MSSPAPSACFTFPRRHRCAKRPRAIAITHQPLAVVFNFETRRQFLQLATPEQEAWVLRMSEARLLICKRFGDKNSSGSERARKFGEQRTVEKVDVYNSVQRFVLEMKAIQVRDHGPYQQMLGARRVRERAHRRLR